MTIHASRTGRLMILEHQRRIRGGESVAFEMASCGRHYAWLIPNGRKKRYYVNLLFLSLPKLEPAAARVSARVAQGGHPVPEDVIRRRFDAGLRNLETIDRDLATSWVL